MIDKEFIAYFKLAHGFLNLCMMALFCHQGWLGYVIRQARTSGAPVPLDAVRRHRKAGPAFALWGLLGYIAGIVAVLLDKGRVFEYPFHLLAGSLLAVVIMSLSTGSREGSRGRIPIIGTSISFWGCACLHSMSSRSCWGSASCCNTGKRIETTKKRINL